MRDPRSESGVVPVGTVIGIGLVILGLYLLLAAFESDSAHYGGVPVPSDQAPIELPEGQLNVYYAEAIQPGSAAPLVVPADLDFALTDAAGTGVDVERRSGDPEETDEGMTQVVGAIYPEADATYYVTATTDQAQGPRPELTVGQSPVQAIRARFDSVVEELNGPTGIIVAIVLLMLFLIPSIQRADRKRNA